MDKFGLPTYDLIRVFPQIQLSPNEKNKVEELLDKIKDIFNQAPLI